MVDVTCLRVDYVVVQIRSLLTRSQTGQVFACPWASSIVVWVLVFLCVYVLAPKWCIRQLPSRFVGQQPHCRVITRSWYAVATAIVPPRSADRWDCSLL